MDKMSTRRKAPSLPLSHFKDTFKLLSDRNDDTASVSSSIPEMSKLEEQQLKRSFQAIQKPETPPPPQMEDGQSNPLFQDEYGKEISQRKDESDSDEERFSRARKTGLVSSQQSSFTEVHPGSSLTPSVQMKEQFERVTNPEYTVQWEKLTTTTESKVHIVPQETRTRTPDSTASLGQLVVGNSIGSEKPAINRHNLGHTMRDQIKYMNQQQETTFTSKALKVKVTAPEPSTSKSTSFTEPSTSKSTSFTGPTTPTSPLQKTMRDIFRDHRGGAQPPSTYNSNLEEPRRPQRLEEEVDKDDNDKRGPCLPRCAVVGVFLAILFGSIVALIVLVDDNRKQEKEFGKVHPDPISYQECANIHLNLTDAFTIKCRFDFNHPEHREIQNLATVTIHRPDGTDMIVPTNFTEGNWTSHNITATCATIGTYSIKFGNNHQFMMNVTLEKPTIEASIEQRFFNDSNGSSQFISNCTVYGDCTDYEANVVGVRGQVQDILKENKTCTTTHSNTQGFNKQCLTTIPDSTAGNYDALKCRVSDDGLVQGERKLELPLCGSNCTTERVNCTEGAEDRLQIDQCQLSTLINRCFYPGRMFHSYCNPETNQCSCVLNWCRPVIQTALISEDHKHPGEQLCGSDFQPVNFTASPPTTTTTTVVTTP